MVTLVSAYFTHYVFTNDDGYMAVEYFDDLDDGDAEGDVVCFVDGGVTVPELMGKILAYERKRRKEADG